MQKETVDIALIFFSSMGLFITGWLAFMLYFRATKRKYDARGKELTSKQSELDLAETTARHLSEANQAKQDTIEHLEKELKTYRGD